MDLLIARVVDDFRIPLINVLQAFRKNQLCNQLYYYSIGIYMFQTLLLKSNYEKQYGEAYQLFELLSQIFILACLLYKLTKQKWEIHTGILCLLVTGVSIITWRISGEAWLLWTTLFICSSQGIKVKQVALVALVSTAICTAFVVLSAAIGIIPIGISIRDTSNHIREAWGFIHPNILGFAILRVCIAFSVLKFGKSLYLDAMLYACMSLIIYIVADSRTSILLMLISIILLTVLYKVKNNSLLNIIRILLVSICFAAIGLSIYFMMHYDGTNTIHYLLNSLLSQRLSLSRAYFNWQLPSLFGNSYAGAPAYIGDEETGFVVDNAFCHIVLKYGILAAVTLFSSYLLALIKLVFHHKNDIILYGMVICAIYGLSEQFGMSVEFNYFLIFIPSLLFKGWDQGGENIANAD